MVFPATQKTTKEAFDSTKLKAREIRGHVTELRNASAAGDVVRHRFITLQRLLTDTITEWDIDAAVPGLAQYARDQYDDQTFDIVVERNAMRAAAVTLRDWIFNNLPKDEPGSGAVLLQTLAQTGVLSPLLFTSVQTAGFRTEADAFLLTIS